MATPSTPVNSSGVNNTITLSQKRVYMGEVLSAFTTTTMMKNFVHIKKIQSGSSGRFPLVNVGKASEIKEHSAGDTVTANTLESGERLIVLGKTLYDARFIDQADKKMLDYDITSPTTKALGVTLAQDLDQILIGLLKKAVKTTGIVGQKDGKWFHDTKISDASLTREQRGNAMIDQILEASNHMDENDVEDEGRIFITSPTDWMSIGQASKTRNKDYQVKNGGVDMYSFSVIWIANIMVIKSNNLIKGLTRTTNGREGFRGFLFTNECIGLLQFIDVITEVNYEYSQFGTWFTSRYRYGADILNPTLCVGIRDVDTPLA